MPALVCFRAAADSESFSKAAEALNLTHGAVSRAVRLLEEDIGVRLFERRNRRVFLTDTGRDLAAVVTDGLGKIDAAVERLRKQRAERRVTVSCEPTLLMRWLIPRLPAFQASFPDVNVQLVAGGGPIALGSGVDVAIRRNDFEWPSNYFAERLFDEHIGPVCQPTKAGDFMTDGQIKPETPLLHTKTRRSAWRDWQRLTGCLETFGTDREFEHFYFSLQAAVAGLGVAVGPWHLVQDDIESGLLAAPLGFVADGTGYYLLSSSGPIDVGSDVAALRDWLQAISTDPGRGHL
ncbi:LysR substrate-binding domain-containing protein [Paracoccaceae bacterium]